MGTIRAFRITFFIALATAFLVAADEPLAPAILAKDVKGVLVDSKELLKNGPVIVWFWNSCCAMKKRQLKALRNVYKQYSRDGLSIIAVNEDEPKKDAQANTVIAIHRIPFWVIMDPEGELMRLFHALAVPQIYVIGSDGTIRYSKAGYMNGDNGALLEAVKTLFESKK
jgi:peroxiredoxin